jgi:hypothetical protein
MPNYLISYSDHKVVLRNYEGYITTYEEPETYTRHDQAACTYCQHGRPEPGQSGVLGLLEGERMWIEPKGFEDVHARGNTEAHRLQDPSKWVPFGVGAIDGKATRPLQVIESGQLPDAAEMTERAATDTNAGIVEAGDLLTPEQLAASANGNRAHPDNGRTYGPGEEPRPKDGEPTASAHGELL